MNSIGNRFRLSTFGESHGNAVGGIIDGCPAGIAIDKDFIATELRRRREGDDTESDSITSRQETDEVEWLSGVMDNITLGTSIAFMIRNRDCRPKDYEQLRGMYRPGHADYTYTAKYGFSDHRGGGRASGRETVARVVAGAVAKQLLAPRGITFSTTRQGHQVSCTIHGVPAGIGDPVFDRLDARLAFAMISIPSAMCFAMGDMPNAYTLPQSDYPDQWTANGEGDTLTKTNHCGGIQGGISNGMPILFHVGFHLPVTNPNGMLCRDSEGNLHHVAPHGRHDLSHLSRLPVIIEAMAALTIADLAI